MAGVNPGVPQALPLPLLYPWGYNTLDKGRGISRGNTPEGIPLTLPAQMVAKAEQLPQTILGNLKFLNARMPLVGSMG